MPDEDMENALFAISGVNQRGEGFVQFRMKQKGKPDTVMQATPAEAREMSRHIAEAAEAAESDSFIMQFLTRKVDIAYEAAAQVLQEFRRYRDVSGGVKARGKDDPHWADMMKRNEAEAKGKDKPFDPTKKDPSV